MSKYNFKELYHFLKKYVLLNILYSKDEQIIDTENYRLYKFEIEDINNSINNIL